MGDVIHTLPALTDAKKANPDLEFDWLVEENFAAIPKWHPAVKNVITTPYRRLRSKGIFMFFDREWRNFKKSLKKRDYDLIIDAQGLIKSSQMAKIANGLIAGYDKDSVREKLATRNYRYHYPVDKTLHAIQRVRDLFSQALGYEYDAKNTDYGLDVAALPAPEHLSAKKYCVFILNTTWPTKHWPIEYWQQLIMKMVTLDYHIVIPGGSPEEYQAIKYLEHTFNHVTVLQRTSLEQLLSVLSYSHCTVSVDTGLSHLSAALDKTTITLYGPTDPCTIGTVGKNQIQLKVDFPCAPCKQKKCTYTQPSSIKPACYSTLPPQVVWQTIQQALIHHD